MTETTLEALSGTPARKRKEKVVSSTLQIAALISVLISAAIVWILFTEAWTFISEVEWATLWAEEWSPRFDGFSIKAIVLASLYVTLIAMVVAGPLGLGAAIYLSEYASSKARSVLKPILEILAGIPSVVVGFFALLWVAPNLVQKVGGGTGGSILAAGIGVGILTIPLVASISEDAMRSVPNALREASAGLGAKKITTTLRVVLPSAVSGLVAAFIIAISRALGETMVVFIAGGAADQSIFTVNPTEGGLTMTAAMASLASGTDNVAGSGLAVQSLYFVGLLLFIFTLVLNMIGNRFVRKVREVY